MTRRHGMRHFWVIFRVGQNHMYTVYIWYIWQGNHQIYGRIQCIYTVLDDPTYIQGGALARADAGNNRVSERYQLSFARADPETTGSEADIN